MGGMVIPEEQDHLLGPTVGLTKDVTFHSWKQKLTQRLLPPRLMTHKWTYLFRPYQKRHPNILRLGLF